MRIVYDDIIYSLQKAGGISEVYSQISQYMPGEIYHYVYDNASDNLSFQKNQNHKYIVLSSILLSIKRFFCIHVNLKTPFIFHSSYYRTSRNKHAINITTVHDFMYEIYRKDLKSLFHKVQKKRAVFKSDGIICISENTKNDLLKYYPNINKPIAVIYNGYDDSSYFFRNSPREKTIVYTGGRKGYKNFQLAVQIVKELKNYHFIIAGGGALTSEETALLSGVQFTKYGFVSSEQLSELYNTSFLFLYPSEYEGFGITPIEAQACGCLVACQMKSSLPEVVRDTAIPIMPQNIQETVSLIKKYEDPTEYGIIQKAGLNNASRFSWKKTAKEYYSFYQQIESLKQNSI